MTTKIDLTRYVTGVLPTTNGGSTGTNTGDQASIVGINGTIAEFNTAITDSDIVDTANTQSIVGVKTFSNNIIRNAGTSAGGTIHDQWQNGGVGRFKAGLVATESGGNTGSNYRFYCYADAGSFIAEVYTIERGTGSIIFGSGVPHISAKLHINSVTKGFLPPVMTTAQRDTIATPAAGLHVENTTTNTYQRYNGTSWGDVGGISWGTSIAGTSGTGLLTTISNSASAGVIGQSIVIGNTQTNALTGLSIDLGTSPRSHTGLKILLGNTNSDVKGIHITTSNANGNFIYLEPLISTYSNNLINCNINTSTTYGAASIINVLKPGGVNWSIGVNLNSNYFCQALDLQCSFSTTLTSKTSNYINCYLSRTNTTTTGTVGDNYNLGHFKRTSIQNGVGGTLTATGSVLILENIATQTAGTLTDTVTPLLVVQGASSTGVPIKITQSAVVSTNFKKLIEGDGITVWKSDGTTPNGALSGTAGDLCLNGPSGQTFFCGGTTTWTGM